MCTSPLTVLTYQALALPSCRLAAVSTYSRRFKLLISLTSGKKTGETSSGPNSAVSSTTTTGSSNHLTQPPKSRSKQKLLQPESSDFKIVFISSDSSKDSDQLNSSLENANENGGQHSSEFMSGEMEYDFPPKIPPKVKNLNLISPGDFSEKMSISTSDGTSIRTAATRDRHSPLLRSPRIQKVRNIPVQKAPSMDDRSITEMSIHDMQMMMHHNHHHHQDSSVLSRSLSESDLSEIIGGATGSDPPSPIHMMAPSDEDENHTGEQLSFEKLMMAHRCFTIGSWDYYLLICGNI